MCVVSVCVSVWVSVCVSETHTLFVGVTVSLGFLVCWWVTTGLPMYPSLSELCLCKEVTLSGTLDFCFCLSLTTLGLGLDLALPVSSEWTVGRKEKE